jgi:hypothetical protein
VVVAVLQPEQTAAAAVAALDMLKEAFPWSEETPCLTPLVRLERTGQQQALAEPEETQPFQEPCRAAL